jgi:Acetyltransferase (GNAT) domain
MKVLLALEPRTQPRDRERADDELGYTFDPAVWGQGFATEAARRVRNYARDVLRLSYLISAILPENARSRRVAERAARESPARWKYGVSRGIATCGRSRPGVRPGSSRRRPA